MQPQRATRGIAAVAVSTAGAGILLLVLALLLSACGSSAGRPAASASSASSTPPSSGPSTAPSTAPSTTAAPTSSGAPAPSGGAGPASTPTDGTVPSVPVTTAPAVPLTAPAPAAGGGAITLGTITSIQGTAQLPGEIAGPAVQVPVTLRNGTGTAIDLNQVVVDLVDRAGVSAGPLSAAPAAPFQGSLAPGATAVATYVFSLAPSDRQDISIVVSYTTAAPVVVFTGTVA